MQIELVTTLKQQEQFIELPLTIYKNELNWIRPLDKDINSVFDPTQNKTFKHGTCVRWLLFDNTICIGRIAAFVNQKYKEDQPTGGIGFFECIDNQTAANLLFDTAKAWLEEKGMEAMDGPINFGDRDKWWGLLVKGFIPPLYCMNYHMPYYQTLFENYGFQVYFNQLCYGMTNEVNLEGKFRRIYEMYNKNDNFELIHIDINQLEKFANDFCIIYNKAFAKMGGGRTMEPRAALVLLKSMKPVIDVNVTYFVYHKKEPIAMWLSLPDLNQYFKRLNGKFGLIEKLRFLYMKTFRPSKKFVGLVYGVVPEWQGKGTDAYMIYDSYIYNTKNDAYTEFEMQWIGDFNPKMINLAASLNTTEIRRLSTYRYLFDRNKEFVRHKMLS